MMQGRNAWAAALGLCTAFVVLSTPLLTSAEGGTETFGEVRRLGFQAGHAETIVVRWNATIEREEAQAWLLKPRIPWKFTVLGPARGPNATFELWVNDRLAFVDSVHVGEGDVRLKSREGWPPLRGALPADGSWAPFLAEAGPNRIRFDVTVRYDAQGRGDASAVLGPLVVEVVPLSSTGVAAALEAVFRPTRLAAAASAGVLVAGCARSVLGRLQRRNR